MIECIIHMERATGKEPRDASTHVCTCVCMHHTRDERLTVCIHALLLSISITTTGVQERPPKAQQYAGELLLLHCSCHSLLVAREGMNHGDESRQEEKILTGIDNAAAMNSHHNMMITRCPRVLLLPPRRWMCCGR